MIRTEERTREEIKVNQNSSKTSRLSFTNKSTISFVASYRKLKKKKEKKRQNSLWGEVVTVKTRNE